jgi:tRNA G26 N,N-dimethylase Trm1
VRLAGRPVKTIGSFQVVEINPNADFIFYDQSKTLQRDVSIASAKALLKERTSLNVAQGELELGGATVRTTPDANGSLDKIEATVSVFAFAQK